MTDEPTIRQSIHALMGACDRQVVLMFDQKAGVYLLPAVLPSGKIEYQVSDGLDGKRGTSHDFFVFAEAKQHFQELVKAGGFEQYRTQRTPATSA